MRSGDTNTAGEKLDELLKRQKKMIFGTTSNNTQRNGDAKFCNSNRNVKVNSKSITVNGDVVGGTFSYRHKNSKW